MCSGLSVSSFPLIVVGGRDESAKIPASDIKMYDDSYKSWRDIVSLPSAKSDVAIATLLF